MDKEKALSIINAYFKAHKIDEVTKALEELEPLYIHLDGFSHSIGFTMTKPKAGTRAEHYTSVGYSGYMSETYEKPCWGYKNEHQKNIATALFKGLGHYQYQRNAQEILF